MRLFLGQSLLEFVAAAGFVAVLLWLDVANLRSLALQSDKGLFTIALLWAHSGTVFGAVQSGVAVMRLGAGHGDRDGANSPRIRS
jgi:bifunctional pyridoxal-dependent enzyme with beta-cystathionase and maltose regulon repressor activities